MKQLTDRALAHLGLRLVLGINMAMHGLTRVFSPTAFADGIVSEFAQTPLPSELVFAFAIVLPFVELAVGLAMLAGLRLRYALFFGLCVLGALTFGTCLQQNWNGAGLQLIYALAFWVLLSNVSDARLTLDGLFQSKAHQEAAG